MFSDEYAAKYVTPHDTCCWMLTCWWTHRITVDLWISQLYDICQSTQLVGEIIGNIIIVHDKSQTLNRKQKENYMNFLLRRDSKTMNQTKEKTCTKVVHSLTIHPSKCTALRMMWCVVLWCIIIYVYARRCYRDGHLPGEVRHWNDGAYDECNHLCLQIYSDSVSMYN